MHALGRKLSGVERLTGDIGLGPGEALHQPILHGVARCAEDDRDGRGRGAGRQDTATGGDDDGIHPGGDELLHYVPQVVVRPQLVAIVNR